VIAQSHGLWRWLLGTAAGLVSLAGVMLNASPAGLAWDTQSIQLVAEPGQKEARTLFHFRNTGAVPIKIASVTTDCDCTIAELGKKIYRPTEQGDINVAFSVGNRTGVSEKTITVTIDEAGAKPVQLHLRVDIRAFFSIEPRMVWWAVGEKPAPKSIVITSQSPRLIRVVAAKPTYPGIGARIETVEAGKKYNVLLEPAATLARGSFSIELQIDIIGEKSQMLHAFALVK
jgi:hypothetical protein